MIYQSPENTGMVMVFQMLINLSKKLWGGCFTVCAVTFPLTQHSVLAQQNSVWTRGAHGPSRTATVVASEVPSQPKFVPIGTRSLVDQYRNDHRQPDLRSVAESARNQQVLSSNRHLVRLPQSGFAAPPLPTTGVSPLASPVDGGLGLPSQAVTPPSGFQEPSVGAPFGLPPDSGTPLPMSNPVPSPTAMAPPTGLPAALPMNPAVPRNVPVASLPSTQVIPGNADMLPIAQPHLNDGFATVGNSCCVSAPSSYVAAMGLGNCVNGGVQPTTSQGYIATGPQVAGPPQVASTVASGLVPVTRPSAPGIPKKPLINLGQNKNAVVVGQGIIGQPVAYVPGQCIRNWIRYISP